MEDWKRDRESLVHTAGLRRIVADCALAPLDVYNRHERSFARTNVFGSPRSGPLFGVSRHPQSWMYDARRFFQLSKDIIARSAIAM